MKKMIKVLGILSLGVAMLTGCPKKKATVKATSKKAKTAAKKAAPKKTK